MAHDHDMFERLMEIENFTAPVERENYVRAPFGWPGGKWQSLKHLLPLIPSRTKVLHEGCGGSGVFTINAPLWIPLKVYNDRHGGVTSFYRCLKDKQKQQAIVDWLSLSVHSREEFIWCKESWQNCTDDVERAARWYYMLKTSFAYLGRNFGRPTSGINSIANKLHTSLEGFAKLHEIWKSVLIENLDVIQSIKDFDGHDTCHFVDPDYLGTDPGIYQYQVNHKRLMETIQESKGFFMVSGYDNPLYNTYKWDDKKQWKVSSGMISQAFNEENHLQDKANNMSRETKATETLWIRDFKD